MIAAMTRHLKSLRYMRRDHGWIHTLLEEAENERMHLLTAMVLRNPGPLFKAAVIGAQGLYWVIYIAEWMWSEAMNNNFSNYLSDITFLNRVSTYSEKKQRGLSMRSTGCILFGCVFIFSTYSLSLALLSH